MNRGLLAFGLTLLSMATAACGDDDGTTPTPDSGMGADSGPADSGMPPTDGGAGDAGADAGTVCTEGCAFVEIAAGSGHTCARRENGEVWCWGENTEGQLGDGRMRHTSFNCTPPEATDPWDCSTPVRATVIDDATAISVRGADGTCAIRADGSLWCWGRSKVTSPGGGFERRYMPTQIAGFGTVTDVSQGLLHQCAVASDGTVDCLGMNSSGQLGAGDTNDHLMTVDTMGITDAIDIEVGMFSFSCARTMSGVKCWGSDLAGQLGDGMTHDGMCFNRTGMLYDCSTTPVDVPALAGITSMSLGGSHACAITSSGSLVCWGDNTLGQIGIGSVDPVAGPTEVPGLTGVTQVSVGASHTCALLSTGEIRCWGAGRDGQLGDGMADMHDRCSDEAGLVDCAKAPVAVVGIDDAVAIASGIEHTCALRASGEIWCWGYNQTMQLGDGTRDTRGEPVQVAGLP